MLTVAFQTDCTFPFDEKLGAHIAI